MPKSISFQIGVNSEVKRLRSAPEDPDVRAEQRALE
jgi:hypothetical protein